MHLLIYENRWSLTVSSPRGLSFSRVVSMYYKQRDKDWQWIRKMVMLEHAIVVNIAIYYHFTSILIRSICIILNSHNLIHWWFTLALYWILINSYTLWLNIWFAFDSLFESTSLWITINSHWPHTPIWIK